MRVSLMAEFDNNENAANAEAEKSQNQVIYTEEIIRKNNRKLALGVYGRTVLAAVLNFIVYMSLALIITGVSTKVIGERIYKTGDDGKVTLVTEILYDDETSSTGATTVTTATTSTAAASTASKGSQAPEQQTKTTAAAQGATSTTLADGQTLEKIRSDVPKSASLTLDILTQVMMIILLISLIYSKLWEQGDKDSNSVQFGRMAENKLRGLHVGLLASIPAVLSYVVLILSKLKLVTPAYWFVYRFTNISVMPVINAIAGEPTVSSIADVSGGSIAAMALLLLLVPLTTYAAYHLGYKHISIMEKIIYVDPQKRRKKRRY